MSPQPLHSPVALESILAAFADLVGVPIEGDSPITLEKVFENFAIRVGPHPLNSSLLMVLVEIALLDLHDPGASAGFLVHLHHFSASQSHNYRWLATMEENASVCHCGEFKLDGVRRHRPAHAPLRGDRPCRTPLASLPRPCFRKNQAQNRKRIMNIGKNAPAETFQAWTSIPNPLQFA